MGMVLRAVFGKAQMPFSIVEIVKGSPKEKTIHFGEIKGQAIRQRYMRMAYDTTDKDGHVVTKTLPLFADIGARTPKYMFSHPNGLPSSLKSRLSSLRRLLSRTCGLRTSFKRTSTARLLAIPLANTPRLLQC
jgi:hypothetical protein